MRKIKLNLVQLNIKMGKKILKEVRMVKDEDTAYDEVMRDIGSIGDNFIINKEAKELFKKKVNQVMRIMNDEEIF